ncbi:MAG: MFS transporter [Planctomycetaceae bacterium]
MTKGIQNPESGRRWVILLFLMSMVYMAHFNRQTISVAGAERLMNQYKFTTVEMGYVYSAFLLIYTMFMTPGGWLGDRIGAVKALSLMGFSFALLEALTGAVSLFPTQSGVLFALIVIRGIAGMTSSPLHPNASRVVSRWMPLGEQPLANSLVTASAMFGISSTYYLFGAMMDHFDWPTSFVIAGSASIVITICWTLYASESPYGGTDSTSSVSDPAIEVRSVTPTAPGHSDIPNTLRLLKNRNLVFLTISYAAVGYFQYLFFYWIEHYFSDTLRLDKDTSRTYSTMSLLAMAAGMLFGGYITKHLTNMKMRIPAMALIPITGLLFSSVCVILGGNAVEPKMVLFWFMLALAGVGMCEGPMWTLAIRMGRQYGGTAGGIFNTGGNMGGIIAPVLTPSIGERYGWDKPLWIASAFCVVGAIMWFWIDVNEELGTKNET